MKLQDTSLNINTIPRRRADSSAPGAENVIPLSRKRHLITNEERPAFSACCSPLPKRSAPRKTQPKGSKRFPKDPKGSQRWLIEIGNTSSFSGAKYSYLPLLFPETLTDGFLMYHQTRPCNLRRPMYLLSCYSDNLNSGAAAWQYQ